jgi:Ca2+-binding EF-hand superfamily protein
VCFLAQLVAKLKSIFDRFDAKSVGRLNGAEVEQMLVYMNRPVGSVQVHEWLQRLKDKEDAIEFPEFVAQYSVGVIALCKPPVVSSSV